MDRFENKEFEGVHYSRFIASFAKEGGNVRSMSFKRWLRQLVINGKSMPEEVVNDIYFIAANGKLELEDDAAMFLIYDKMFHHKK